MKKSLRNLLGSIGLFTLVLGVLSFAPIVKSFFTSTYYVNPSVGSNLVYGKVDTVIGGGTDTFRAKCATSPTSITFTNEAWRCAGAGTLTVACYVSGNGGMSFDPTPIITYTLTPGAVYTPSVTGRASTNKVSEINVSGGGGNPYTDYMWVGSNTAASSITVSWLGWALPRQ